MRYNSIRNWGYSNGIWKDLTSWINWTKEQYEDFSLIYWLSTHHSESINIMWELILPSLNEISNHALNHNPVPHTLQVDSNLSIPWLCACNMEASNMKLRTQHPTLRRSFSKMFCQREELHDSFWNSKHKWHTPSVEIEPTITWRKATRSTTELRRLWCYTCSHFANFERIIWTVALTISMKIKA